MNTIQLTDVKIQNKFWKEYLHLVKDVVIPYQYGALNDFIPDIEPSHSVKNFKIACKEETGEFSGFVFQDSDLYKWIEAVGYSLSTNPDPDLEKKADETIDYIAKAQQPDGYVNTYYIINGLEKRFTNLVDCHELYCLGHMIEAAVAYYIGTGKRKLLDVACRFVELIDSLFGEEEGKLKGYPGHQEIELALVRLYEITKDKKHLDLAAFFINQRGQEPNYFFEEWEKRGKTRHWDPAGGKPNLEYCQAHKPVREQTEAIGHAVRAVYMYTGMAKVAQHTKDESLLKACKTLWKNIVQKQLYITGGIGQTSLGEAFTFDYDLPNDTVYAETCASIGLIFFAKAMLDQEIRSEYADVMERALYNTVLAGMSQDGQHFFYVNPLEVWPEASHKSEIRKHVRPVRPGWFPCSCCPPNVTRLLASLGQYVYTQTEDGAYVHLYIGGKVDLQTDHGKVTIKQENNYPWDGDIQFTVHTEADSPFSLYLRMPSWCDNPSVTVNGKAVSMDSLQNGYLCISRSWSKDDVVLVSFPMQPKIMHSHSLVRANVGKVAVQYGPIVYCAEEADNGANINALRIDTKSELKTVWDPSFFGGAVLIDAQGLRENNKSEDLYSDSPLTETPVTLRLIPYYLWSNRTEGEMSVWLRS